MVTIMVNGVFPSIAKLIQRECRNVSTKVLIADYSDTADLRSVLIVCEYILLVEVIRRIHIICDSSCDYVDITIK